MTRSKLFLLSELLIEVLLILFYSRRVFTGFDTSGKKDYRLQSPLHQIFGCKEISAMFGTNLHMLD